MAAAVNGYVNGTMPHANGFAGNGAAVQFDEQNQIQLFIKIPEKRVECIITVDLNAKVWEIKQQIISTLCSDVEENFNFGLFLPQQEKRLGKYMSEDRCIKEYRLSGLPPTVYFKYYSRSQEGEKDSKKTKTKDFQQKFFEYICEANVEKATKLLDKGFDPNFIHRGSGHTPLTKAVVGKDARNMIMLLCRYGAFLEFRDRNGFTALHHAAINGAHESMKVLLDAGASVNARDLKGLTPLYNTICEGTSTYSCEVLLKEKCDINVVDTTCQWTELHQACKRGKTEVVELLLLYGAEINARTSAGNTSLHMCASFNKVHCARVLLYRGIDKTIRNKAGQTAHDVAALTANLILMENIANFKPPNAEPFSSSPAFTTRKKEAVFVREGSVSSTRSNPAAQQSSDPPRATQTLPRSATVATTDANTLSQMGVEPVRTGSIGTSSSSGSNTGSLRALPAEFPAPSSTTLQMTLEELIKTARICKIPKTKRGYGFHVKGLSEKKKEFTPSVEAPCSQFMFGVDKDSESHKAGVMANDFIHQINGKDVSVASHREVVELIKKSGDPLILSLIQVVNQQEMPPPAVPKRDPTTRLQGPARPGFNRSYTVGGVPTANNPNNGEQIYANVQRPANNVSRVLSADISRTLERMNSAPGGMGLGDGYTRSNTLPLRPLTARAEEEQKKEEVVMIPVLPNASAAEINEQRARLTSTSTADNNSLQSTQSEPVKPVSVSRSPDNRPVLDEATLPPKSKSAEDIARKAAEMRQKRGALKPGEKAFNYDLPPPPTAIPPPPPPDDLPPPPPAEVRAPSPPPPPSVTEAIRVPSPPPPPSETHLDREDNESYDSGFIQNGKHVEDWESVDVADWLSGLGLGEYKDIFVENDIRGPNLLELSKNDLKELGVTKLGHRITLMKEIKSRLSEGR